MDYPENYLLLEKLRSSNHDSSSRDKLLHLLLSKTPLFITVPNEGCLLSFLHPGLSRKLCFVFLEQFINGIPFDMHVHVCHVHVYQYVLKCTLKSGV